MMLKENLESSCGTPDITGPYVCKMTGLICEGKVVSKMVDKTISSQVVGLCTMF